MMMNGWMWVWPVLVLAGLVLLGYGVVRLAQGWPPVSGDDELGAPARRILDERFARGEIDEDDYWRRRSTLS